MSAAETFRKHRPQAPSGLLAAEAAGLRWLAGATGGVRTVLPLNAIDESSTEILLPRVPHTRPVRPAHAHEFGRRLARTHATGGQWFGRPPADRDAGSPGFIGDLPLTYVTRQDASAHWGTFYAEHRLLPYARQALAQGSVSPSAMDRISVAVQRLQDGDPRLCGPPEPPARIHGDLWSGNVMWDDDGAVLIDPAAHGGHRETDLAMLALFGLPDLDAVLTGYQQENPLADGWPERVAVHQLHPVLVHAVLFGGRYGQQAEDLLARFLD